MADAKMVSEGSAKDFVKNFRQISELIKKNYGLTKAESEALNKEHMAQATNRMLGTLLAGSAIGSGISALPIAGTIEASLGIVNQGRKAASGDLVEDTEKLVSSRLKDKDNKTTKQRLDLASAQKKIRGTGIYPAGTTNEYLNADFVSNLRKANGNRWGMELDSDGTWGMYGYPDSNKIPQSRYIRGK